MDVVFLLLNRFLTFSNSLAYSTKSTGSVWIKKMPCVVNSVTTVNASQVNKRKINHVILSTSKHTPLKIIKVIMRLQNLKLWNEVRWGWITIWHRVDFKWLYKLNTFLPTYYQTLIGINEMTKMETQNQPNFLLIFYHYIAYSFPSLYFSCRITCLLAKFMWNYY